MSAIRVFHSFTKYTATSTVSARIRRQTKNRISAPEIKNNPNRTHNGDNLNNIVSRTWRGFLFDDSGVAVRFPFTYIIFIYKRNC